MTSNKYNVTSTSKKWPQILTVATAFIIIFSSGIHIGWSSPSIPKILSEEFPLDVTLEEASYFVVVPSLTQIIGIISFSILMDLIGRKTTLLLAAPIFILSSLCVYFSPASIVLLHVSRVLGGVAEGGCNVVVPVYICEVAEPQIRGALGCVSIVFWNLGVLFINLVGSYCSLQTASFIASVFPLLFLVFFSFMPESPYYYLMRRENQKALNSLQFLRRSENVNEELSSLEKAIERQMSEEGRLRDLFLISSNRKATMIMSMLSMFQSFSGLAPLTSYAQTFFAETSNLLPTEWAAALMQILKLITMFVAATLIDNVGRRILLLVSTLGCCLMMILVSSFFLVKDYTFVEVGSLSWFPLIGILVFVVFYMLGLGVVSYCLIGELFSTSVKSKALCLVNIIFSLSIFSSTKLFQTLSDNCSTGVPLLIFGVVQFFGFGFCLWFVPETKKKTLEEIQQDLKSHR